MEFLVDHGLVGPAGARTVLAMLESHSSRRQPARTTLTLSHNELGDQGIKVLTEGLLALYKAKLHPGIQELNLASNLISDAGLLHIITNLLLPSMPPHQIKTSLRKLFLNANEITLSDNSHVPSLFAAALSHPSCKLTFLSLTHNPGISLSRFLKSCTPTSLTQLHLNVCELADDAEIIAWLGNPNGGGRITHLQLNGNLYGYTGMLNLLNSVGSGLAMDILHLELFANANESELSGPEATKLQNARESVRGALSLNLYLRRSRHAMAFRMLYLSRILLLGRQRDMLTPSEIFAQISLSDASDQYNDPRPFPWLKLPPELQNSVLKWTALVQRSKRSSVLISQDPSWPVQVLSNAQMMHIIAYAGNANTLRKECRRFLAAEDEKISILQAIHCLHYASD